jgi:hypothetical protein
MKRSKWLRGVLVALVLMGLGALLLISYNGDRPLPIPMHERLFTGVDYSRNVQWTPRPLIIHVITVDVRSAHLGLLVTPPDVRGSDKPLRARTTSQFLQEFGAQIAINGDGFSPWWSRGIADYYPHEGDPVRPRGNAASRGRVYWSTDENLPTLYISSRNQLSFDAPTRPFNALSGESMLVMGGASMPNLDDRALQPRTAIGYSRNARYLYLVVVDGRQPFYSEGITLHELARLMISLGAAYAMNLDGGGSSTMVVEAANGKPRILNSPIDNYIPGRERPVANHLGVFVDR